MKDINQKAIELYDIYTAAVGGKAFNGAPLPCGKDFMSDPAKQKQADAWRAVAAHVLGAAAPAEQRTYRIAIDIGHARHTGATGNGYQEHTVCSKLATALKAALESLKLYGFEADIIDFPALSNGADLAATAKAVNAGDYAACVSLHMDASDNPDAHGAHVCYYSAAGKLLAQDIALRLCPQLPGRASRTVKRTDLYILKKTRPVAVLVECGFITNEGDTAWVIEHPNKVALAIALGIATYFTA